MIIHPVSSHNYAAVLSLLQQNNLPTEDITNYTRLFTLYDDGELTGIVGIELKGEDGLLRSLCVSESKRSGGAGRALVEKIESYARKQGVKHLYLLTTTAAPFFTNLDYQTIDRSTVPDTIKETSEFASVCPASATVMKKELSAAKV
jgi:amino-acid N-acetyltransferase